MKEKMLFNPWRFDREEPAEPPKAAEEVAEERDDFAYILNLVSESRPYLEKHSRMRYQHMLSELKNARCHLKWEDIWGVEHALIYASRDMDDILEAAIRSTQQEDCYKIDKEEFQILMAVFEELRAIRWDYHRQLYDGRFTYDRRYSP